MSREADFCKRMPLVTYFSMAAKFYAGVLTKRLSHLDFDKYFSVLMIIEQCHGPVTQQQLADLLDADKAGMVRLVDYLTQHGLLLRQQNPDDRREYFLILTEKARKALLEINAVVEEVNDIIFEGATEAERRQFNERLVRVNEALSALPAEKVYWNLTNKKPQKTTKKRQPTARSAR